MCYSCQLLLEEPGVEGRRKRQRSRALIVGLAGPGSPAALYLAPAGVGKLLLADDDALHISNLQRQIFFRSHKVCQPKARLAQHQLQSINPHVEYIALEQWMDSKSSGTGAIRAA